MPRKRTSQKDIQVAPSPSTSSSAVLVVDPSKVQTKYTRPAAKANIQPLLDSKTAASVRMIEVTVPALESDYSPRLESDRAKSGTPVTCKTEATGPIWELDCVCHECNETITGFRYRCIEGCAYDACAACVYRGAHAHHHMLRIPPSATTRETLHKLEALKQRIQLEIDRLLEAIREQEHNVSTPRIKLEVGEEVISDPRGMESRLPSVCSASESTKCTTADTPVNAGTRRSYGPRDDDHCQVAVAVKEEPGIFCEGNDSTELHERDPLRIKVEPPEFGSDSGSRCSYPIRHSATKIKRRKINAII